ncbi:MAG: hypothetical protein V4641_01820 [Pseudomonadota bacterium]
MRTKEQNEAMAALLIDAAAECTSPDQMSEIAKMVEEDGELAGRLIACINKRQAPQQAANHDTIIAAIHREETPGILADLNERLERAK